MLLIPGTPDSNATDAGGEVLAPPDTWRLNVGQRLAKKTLLRSLGCLVDGAMTLVDGEGVIELGRTIGRDPLHGTVLVRHPRFYTDLALEGSVGAGRAYSDGLWACDDLTTVVRILVRNRAVLDECERGPARLSGALRRLLHRLRRNTRSGSRHNIAAHYDLSNEFFATLLDDTMTYSCGFFESPDRSLHDASVAKNDRVCRKLSLSRGDHVLEIGAGWGGFALHAAGRYGCKVTTTTVSRQQYEFVRRRILEAGLSDRVTVLHEDYRDLAGEYDKVVSIEMIEAVGHEYYETFFRQCSDLLKPDGLMLLQAIVIEDHRYEQARRSVDFIKQFIFPGSCIPSISAVCGAVARAADLQLFDLEDIGAHYVTTLRAWRGRLLSSAERVRALGFPEAFLRLWEFYLCYCEGGFAERSISDVQMLFAKPRSLHPSSGIARVRKEPVVQCAH